MLALLLSAISSVSYTQKLSLGFTSGINISDIHILSNNYEGKWKFKPGPSEGIFIDYSISPILGIQTGLNYSTVYYEYDDYNNYYYYPWPILHYSSSSVSPYYLYSNTCWMMDFSYLTVPLQLKITIPSRPQLNLGVGAYYSFLLDSNYEYDYLLDEESKKNDLGFIYSAGLTYPVSDRFSAIFNVRYLTGRREIDEYEDFWHGFADFTVGLSYDLIPGERPDNNKQEARDSIKNKIYLTYRGGLNLSWNSCNPHRERYSPYAGPSLGFNIGFEMSPGTYFRTGLSFERQGYTFRDSSDYYHRYVIRDDADYYVNTRISTDYLVIPALFEFYTGEYTKFYFNTGPYFGIRLNARCTGTALSENGDYYPSYPYYEETEITTEYKLKETTVYDDLEAVIQNTDLGWLAGAGLVLPLRENLALDIGLQFRQGFFEVYDTDVIQEELRPGRGEALIRNSSLALHIGLRLPVYK